MTAWEFTMSPGYSEIQFYAGVSDWGFTEHSMMRSDPVKTWQRLKVNLLWPLPETSSISLVLNSKVDCCHLRWSTHHETNHIDALYDGRSAAGFLAESATSPDVHPPAETAPLPARRKCSSVLLPNTRRLGGALTERGGNQRDRLGSSQRLKKWLERTWNSNCHIIGKNSDIQWGLIVPQASLCRVHRSDSPTLCW